MGESTPRIIDEGEWGPRPHAFLRTMTKTKWFTIKRVLPQVFSLAEFHHFEKVVSYLFVGKTEAVLFDTGTGYADIKLAIRSITHLPVRVLLTHAHWDHIGGVNQFDSVSVYNDPFEEKCLQNGFTSTDIEELHKQIYFQKPYTPHKYSIKGTSDYKLLSDREVIFVGDIHIKVNHTPGHTPGSACYLLEELNILIAGDTIYPGPLYAYLPESDIVAYSQSIKKLLSLTNDGTLILPGHNAITSPYKLLEYIDKGFEDVLSGLAIGEKQKEGYFKYPFQEFSILCSSLL